MDKFQFLDLSDVEPGDVAQLSDYLYGEEYPVVEMPPEDLPTWVPAVPVPVPPYQSEPVNGDGQLAEEQPLDYNAQAQMMAPHTIGLQYPVNMVQPPSVYVSNVTANVNLHGFMPGQTIAYSPTFISSTAAAVDNSSRKPRPAKTSPTKRSPDTRRTLDSPQTNYPAFTQPFTAMYPAQYMAGYPYPLPAHSLPQQFNRQLVSMPMYPASVPPVYNPYTQVFTAPVQAPPEQPTEEAVTSYPDPDVEEKVEEPEYEPEEAKEEPPLSIESVVVENNVQHNIIEEIIPVVEIESFKVEELKEKSLVTKAPPATAFRSAPSSTPKPPFPPALTKKRDSGPEFIDPPKETVPLKKSFASLFGEKKIQMESPKPQARIPPMVYNSVSPPGYNGEDKSGEPAQEAHAHNKVMPDKMILPDYDINLQRLGEFLVSYQLDHKPVLLQPRGLTNRSNYCYINAILQALLACPPFYNLMKATPASQENKSGKSPTPIIDSMVKFVNEFQRMGTATRPVGRKEKAQATKDGGSSEVVCGPSFEPTYVYKMLSAMHAAFPVEGRQEDAEEFLSCLLNGLNDEMLEAMKLMEPPTNGLTNGDVTTNGEPTPNGNHNPDEEPEWTEVITKNKSVVTRRAEFGRTPLSAIFRGQMRSRVTRGGGVDTGITDNVQPFFTLQLDIEKANSVEKALEQVMSKDEVFGGVCPKTNQEISMYTQTSLEELPLILLLHLKCFDYKLQTCSKIVKTVEFPIDLKIDHKLLTSKNKTNTKDRQYKLLAVVYHDGKEATKGHYITDVFHMGYSGWVRFDDATVRPVTPQQVLNPKSPRVPYLLYYRRCDTMQDKTR